MIRAVVLSAALLEVNAQCGTEKMGGSTGLCKDMCAVNPKTGQNDFLLPLKDVRRLRRLTESGEEDEEEAAGSAFDGETEPEHIIGNVCCDKSGEVRDAVFGDVTFERAEEATDPDSSCEDSTADIMADCQAFCDDAPGIAVPVLIGGEKWGLDLGDATQICMSPDLLGGSAGYTEKMKTGYNCYAKHDYLEKILKEVVAFSKTVKLFQYEGLKFRATIAMKSRAIKEELSSEEVFKEFDFADKQDKPGLVIDKYKYNLEQVTAEEGALQAKAETLKEKIGTLKTVVEDNIALFLEFITNCNMFFPKMPVFMKDLCRVTHGPCVETPLASHAQCCCLVNPVGKFARPGGGNEELEDPDAEQGPVDISAAILSEADEELEGLRSDIEAMGEGEVLSEYEGSLKTKYGKNYVRPCFPSTATVLGHDGATRPIHSLKEGDSILAADAHGNLIYDTVSIFSLRDNATDAAFVSLDVGGRLPLTLTPGHHLPTGKECCSQLTQAKDVHVGDVVWVAAEGPDHSKSRSLEARVIKAIGKTTGTGLHNPLLTHGNHPVINGVVTAFNAMHVVSFNSYVVPVVSQVCKWLGTCDATRRVVAAAECAYKHSTHALKHRALSEAPLCTALHYIDGTAIHAGSYI